jgi:subtilisin family serine protease
MLTNFVSSTQDSVNSPLNLAAIASTGLTQSPLLSGLESLFSSDLTTALPPSFDVTAGVSIPSLHVSTTAISDADLLTGSSDSKFINTSTSTSNLQRLRFISHSAATDSLTGYDFATTWVGEDSTDTLLTTNAKHSTKEAIATDEPLDQSASTQSTISLETADVLTVIDQPAELDETTTTDSLFRDLPQLSFETLTAAPSVGTSTLLDSFTINAASSMVQYIAGTLQADTFFASPTYRYTVLSGNGNVQYGSGRRDFIDLSNISSRSVWFDLAGMNGDGELYNPGSGARVFDAMTLSNGQQILFEGIDAIRFADGILNLSVTPNDTYFDYQWNLHMMGVHNAWRFTTGSSSEVLIGVQDTGLAVNYSDNIHPDLEGSRTYVYYDNVADETIGELSHGTAVHSIIAADSNNGFGMSGINWNSDVLNIDVLDGEFNDFELNEATQAMINEATRSGRQLIINMSLGGDSGGWTGMYPELERLIANNQNNVLFVIAAGNENRSYLSYPAVLANLYSNVIAVGASWGMSDRNGNPTEPGQRISYPGSWGSNYGYGISMMGPSEVVAAEAVQFFGTDFDFTGDFNGTSAATPNVAGVASLVWSANPNLTATQVHRVLAETAYDLGNSGYDYVYGHGFVNADAAVRRAIALTMVPDSPVGAA